MTDEFEATYEYSNIHNMKLNEQVHKITTGNGAGTEGFFPPHTNHEFAYTHDPQRPHQATKIGDTFLTHDPSGNTRSECRDHADPTCNINRDHYRQYNWTEENWTAAGGT
ncbi:MAG TPA: hypothetical protein VLT47_03020 [Anaeromyxobacteraceae bacterium]|nr:hypothetical protein [Anaeromyxobacteraceae bacterium]